jgi:hypothetical protein
MTLTDDQLVTQLRLGHPDTDGYTPPSFAAVLAAKPAPQPRSLRSWFAPLAAAAVIVVAVAGVALIGRGERSTTAGGFVPASPLAVTSAPAVSPDPLSAADRATIARLAAVTEPTVLAVDGGAVVTRWRDGRVQLLWASGGPAWTLREIASVYAPTAAGAVATAVDSVTCAGSAARPTFVYGMFVGMPEGQLSIHGVDGVGGRISGGTFAFAVANATPGSSYWIDGPHDPGAPSPFPTAPGVSEPAHPGSYFAGPIPGATTCVGF